MFLEGFQEIPGESKLKGRCWYLGTMLIPSRGSRTFPALCRHKYIQGHTDTHTSPLNFSPRMHTHTYPLTEMKNEPGGEHVPFSEGLGHALPRLRLSVTAQGRQSCIALLVCRREK